jgi:hypothetical protein
VARKWGPDWRRMDAPGDSPGRDAPDGAAPEAECAAGLECPECGCRHFETIKSEQRPWGILRRKACRHCGRRVTTRERLVP